MEDLELPTRPQADAALVDRLRDRLLARVTAGGMASFEELPEIVGYRIGKKLGEGGMGQVWAAENADGEPLAIKVMKNVAAGNDASRRFLREARALAQLRHDGIVAIRDVGQTADGRLFFAMDRIEGPTLAAYLMEHGPLPWDRAHSVLEQIATALLVAHGHGVIHRDIKPSNIMLIEHPNGLRCRLIDFGLARHHPAGADASSCTIAGQVFGTPAYMSPEQLRGEPADERSDIYAWGCVAYEMLTGRQPFGVGTPEELFYRHLMQPVAPPEDLQVPKRVKRAVEAVILRALRKQPRDRFPSMRAVLAALSAAAHEGVVVAVPEERRWAPEQTWSTTLRRRKTPLAAVGVVVASIVGGALRGELSSSISDDGSAPERSEGPGGSETKPRQAAIEITAGVSVTCALSEASDIQCWGSDSAGRLGRGSEGANFGDNEFPNARPPLQRPVGRTVAQIAFDSLGRHGCARFVDGGVRCWGHNIEGELGIGNRDVWGDDPHETLAAMADLPLPPATDIVTGDRTTCIIDAAGQAYCWGRGDEGVLGTGTTATLGDDEQLDDKPLRAVALGGARVRRMDLGRKHACALLDDGTVRCWGDNDKGQLGVPGWRFRIGDGIGDGQGRGERPDDPTLAVAALEDVEVVDVVAGFDRSCVVTREGTVRCWGDNSDGVLGYRPATVPGCDEPQHCVVAAATRDIDFDGIPVDAVVLAQQHACALDRDGGVHCWGLRGWGRTGYGRTHRTDAEANSDVYPIALEPSLVDLGDGDGDGEPDRAVQLAAGDTYTCALMETGGARCWGYGVVGALGYASADIIGDNETPAEYYVRIGVTDIPVF